MKTTTCKYLLSVLLVLTFCSYATAQTRSILGKVTDPDGNPLADVQITISGIDNPRTLKCKTDKKGEYLYLIGLQHGIYHVVARKEGYEPKRESPVEPELGEEVELNFTLRPGEDYKFPHEMTDEERAEYLKKYEANTERRKNSVAVSEFFDKGVEFLDKKMYAEAIDEFNKGLELDPEQVVLVARIGDTYLKMEKYEEALASYERAIELDPTDPKLFNNKGVVLDKMGKKEESEKAFEEASQITGGGAQELYNLGVTKYNAGNMEEAAAAFKRAIAADSGYTEAYYLLGNCLLGDTESICEALDMFRKYISLGGKADNVDVAKQMIEALGASCE
jgi:tetratricopeptide (TPR) repeat protein